MICWGWTRVLPVERSDVWVGEGRAILGALTLALAMAYFVARRLPAFENRAAEGATVALCGGVPAFLLTAWVAVHGLPMDLLLDVPLLMVPVPVAVLGTAGLLSAEAALAARTTVRARAGRTPGA